MKKNPSFLTLTALLLAQSMSPRGEGESVVLDSGNTRSPANDGRLSEAEWQARTEALHAKSTHVELIRRVAELERQNEGLKAGQVPRGSRVLNGQEAKDYDTYLALGKPDEVTAKLQTHDAYAALGTPDELKTKVESGTKPASTLAEREKADAVRAAAEAIGFKNSVLGDRLTVDGLTDPVVREVEQGGKKLRVAYVKDAQGAEHDLAEYAKKNWTDYLPALQVQTSTATVWTEFTRQDATTTASSGGGSWVQQTLANQNKGGAYQDPLQPQTQTAVR